MNRFQQQMQKRLIAYKECVQHIPREAGQQPYLYPKWNQGLFPPTAKSFISHLEKAAFKLHSWAHHVRSSQIFAFNLFWPFVDGDVQLLVQPLSRILPELGHIEKLNFEFVPETDVLGEWPGDKPKGAFTASDVGIIYRTAKNQRAILLIEVKFTEAEFTPCNGYRSCANTRRDVCEDWHTFCNETNMCYLVRTKHATKDRRYWEILTTEFGDVAHFIRNEDLTMGKCPFIRDFQQPMRNHTLALGMLQQKSIDIDIAHICLVYHDQNQGIRQKWQAYRNAVSDPGRVLTLPATKVLRGATSVQGGFWSKYLKYHKERYGLRVGN